MPLRFICLSCTDGRERKVASAGSKCRKCNGWKDKYRPLKFICKFCTDGRQRKVDTAGSKCQKCRNVNVKHRPHIYPCVKCKSPKGKYLVKSEGSLCARCLNGGKPKYLPRIYPCVKCKSPKGKYLVESSGAICPICRNDGKPMPYIFECVDCKKSKVQTKGGRCRTCLNKNKTCSNEGCTRKLYVSGLCDHHYNIKRKGFTNREEKVLELANRFGSWCQVCLNMFPAHELQLDHIHPISKADLYQGEDINEDSNLQLLCKSCNCSKGDSLPMVDSLTRH